MLKVARGLISAALAIASVLVALAPAQAADGTTCDGFGVCSVQISKPGSGGSSIPGTADPTTGLTPGPTACQMDGKDVPCTSDAGSWDNGAQCYWKISDPQKAPPAGETTSTGAWYDCNHCPPPGAAPSDPSRPGVCSISSQWLATPPPGINKLTPGQAAAALIKSFQLKPIEIGIVPYDKPGSVGVVGLPVWMWAKNPQPLTTGPYTQTASLGGVSITATAKLAATAWSMGDGQTVTCYGPGTPWDGTVNPSPDCGYRYSRQSAGQPNDSYTVTALSEWLIDWNGGGQNGQINLERSSSTQIKIGEIQTFIN